MSITHDKNQFIVFGEYHTSNIRDLIETEIRKLHTETPIDYILSEELGPHPYLTQADKERGLAEHLYSISDRTFKLGLELNIPVVGITNWDLLEGLRENAPNHQFNQQLNAAQENFMLSIISQYRGRVVVLLSEPHIRRAEQLRTDPSESPIYSYLKQANCIIHRYIDLNAANDDIALYNVRAEVRDIIISQEDFSKSVQAATEAVIGKNTKRQAVESYILKNIDSLDPSGINGKRYRELFAKMSDAMFDRYMQALRDKKSKIIFYAPNMKVKVRMEDVLTVAQRLGVKLFERIKLWDPVTHRYYLTPKEYLVVRLPVRRLKQYLESKMSVPESDTTVDLFTGQVIKPDKGSSVSLVEIQTLLSKNLTASITELAKVRGGDIHAYAAIKGQLEENGSAHMSELDQGTRVRSVVVMNAYLRAMLLDSNF